MKRTVNYFSYHYGLLTWVALVFLIFGQVAPASSAQRLLLRPAESVAARSEANVAYKPYEIRKGRVVLAADILSQPPVAANRQAKVVASTADTETFTLSFFADVAYEVTVDSVTHLPDGTMIINGRLKDHQLETVVLTIGPDGFLITLQDMLQALLYRVAGNTVSAEGDVTEIDMTKMPPLIR
jgi:hypothetical protein